MPDAVSSLRPTRALVAAVVAAAASLWIGFAVVAGATRTSPQPAAPAQPVRGAVPTRLALSAAPPLRVRSALLEGPAARATARATPPAPAHASASPGPAAAMSAPASSTSTPEPTRAAAPTPTPTPRSAPKSRPTLTAEPKRPSRPDFDQSQPDGFDNAG